MIHPITIETAEAEINLVIKLKLKNDYIKIFFLYNMCTINDHNYPTDIIRTIFLLSYEHVRLHCRLLYTILRTDKMHLFGNESNVNRYELSGFKTYDPALYDKQIFFNSTHIISLGADNNVYLWKNICHGKIEIIKSASNIKFVDDSEDQYGETHVLTNMHTARVLNQNKYNDYNSVDTIINSICCGYNHTLYLTTDDCIIATGSNAFGQLGSNNLYCKTNIIKLPNVVSIYCGCERSFFLTNRGKLYGCGRDACGELGLIGRFADPENRKCVNYIITAIEIPSDEQIVDVKCGLSHTLALTTNGNVYAWGMNIFKKLGIKEHILHYPQKLKIANINTICCGSYHAIFLSKNETAYYFEKFDYYSI